MEAVVDIDFCCMNDEIKKVKSASRPGTARPLCKIFPAGLSPNNNSTGNHLIYEGYHL